jgi:hypothetical protein
MIEGTGMIIRKIIMIMDGALIIITKGQGAKKEMIMPGKYDDIILY